jgi:transcriptional regulator with XRE-family HTH domain
VQTEAKLTGPQLREFRKRRSLRAADIAAATGLSRQRIGQIEAAAAPTKHDLERYFEALNRFDLERAS